MSEWISPAACQALQAAAQVPGLRRLVLAGGEERDQLEQRERAVHDALEARTRRSRAPRASTPPPRPRARAARPRAATEIATAPAVARRRRARPRRPAPRRRPRRRSPRRAPAWRSARRGRARRSARPSGTGTERTGRPACSAAIASRSHASSAIDGAVARRAPRARSARGGARPARGRRRSARSRSCPCPRTGRPGRRGGSRSGRGARARRAAARRSRGCWPGTGCRAPRPCARPPPARRCRGTRSCPARRSRSRTTRATSFEPLVLHPDDRDVRLDRRERVVRGLRARLRERVEQRGLARVGHPDDADLHHRPKLPSSVPSPAPAATSDG